MKTVKLTVGLPGSGKSYWVMKQFQEAEYPAFRASADDYFVGADGVYRFDPRGIGDAHKECFESFMLVTRSLGDRVVEAADVFVDNTNLSPEELAPYMAVAHNYGWNIEIHFFDRPPILAYTRQTHGVPLATFNKMCEKLDRFRKQLNKGYFLWPCKVITHKEDNG